MNSCVPCPAGTEGISNAMTLCTPCPAGFVSGSGSTMCEIMEHEPVVLLITGSIHTFYEGSEHRRAFLSSLASILAISESRIFIVSIKSGSVIIELAILRDSNSTTSPSDAISRLKDAFLEGKLELLGVKDLSIDSQSIKQPSVLSPLVIGVSTAGAVFLSVILFVSIKYGRRILRKQNEVTPLSPALTSSTPATPIVPIFPPVLPGQTLEFSDITDP